MKYLLAQKQGMSQVFNKKGNVIPVTLLWACPNTVTQVKTEAKESYNAIQLGFGKKKKISKALRGHLKKLGDFRFLREFRLSSKSKVKSSKLKVRTVAKAAMARRRQNSKLPEYKVGDVLTVEQFKIGSKAKVVGISKGKGFQGVMKRWGFHGGPASHGAHLWHRRPGSIGSRFPQHTRKGKKMPGRMGGDRITVKGLGIVKIDSKNNLLAVKGAVPGTRGSLVMLSGE